MSQYFLVKRYGRGPRFAHLANGELEPLCGTQVNLDLWEVKTLATGRPGRWCEKCIVINRQKQQPGERHDETAISELQVPC